MGVARSPAVPIGPQDWRVRAACRGHDGAPFFAPDGEGKVSARTRVARAKSVCARCPVRAQCAAQALLTREEHGVWGGFTSRERKRLLALGWADLVDQRQAGVDVTGLERRLIDARETVPPPGPAPDQHRRERR